MEERELEGGASWHDIGFGQVGYKFGIGVCRIYEVCLRGGSIRETISPGRLTIKVFLLKIIERSQPLGWR